MGPAAGWLKTPFASGVGVALHPSLQRLARPLFSPLFPPFFARRGKFTITRVFVNIGRGDNKALESPGADLLSMEVWKTEPEVFGASPAQIADGGHELIVSWAFRP